MSSIVLVSCEIGWPGWVMIIVGVICFVSALQDPR